LRLRTALADRYTIERELGHGGAALVYLAHDLKHHRQVAVKVLRPALAAAIGPDRFLREIEIAARLSHPHILPLYDSGATETIVYYMMPVVEGESLRDRITREGQLPLEEALRIAGQVADALAYAHGHNVVHRDIKPENILLASGEALVADFGIARAIGVAAGDQLTETGLAVGTPAYMSPEQAAGDATIDGRTDIYALGCVLYEMLAGQPPFTGATAQAVLARHAVDPVPPLHTIRPDLPAALDRTVLRALAKAPADRFTSAAALKAALIASATEAPRRHRAARWAVWGLAVLGLGIAAAALFRHRRGPPVENARAIAVLPFANIGGDSSDEYFSDGMSEELIAALGKFPGLRVAARTSAFSFKHKSVTAPEIGRALHVGTLLEGTVRRSGTRIRVHAELISAADGYQLWSEEYERDVKDVFAVQDEISRAIVGALQLRLSGGAGASLVHRQTVSPEAHDLYLKGRFFFGRRSGGEDLRRAVAYFEQTIRTDSTYAEAYSGLSDAYSVLSIWDYLPPDSGFPRAKAAALRALQLDSTLAEAHTSLGIIDLWYDYDRSAGERELTRAIALDPQYPPAHLFYGWYLVLVGRTADAVREARQARELDPLSVIINTRVGSMLFFARRYPEAITQLQRTLELDSINPLVHAELAQAWMAQGRCSEALAASGSIPASFPNYEGFIVGYAEARCGRRAEAARLVRGLEASATPSDAAYLKIAAIYTGLGDRDAAFTWLNRVRPTYFLSFAKTHPLFASLHGDPRYAPLLGRIGLQP